LDGHDLEAVGAGLDEGGEPGQGERGVLAVDEHEKEVWLAAFAEELTELVF